MLLIPHTVVAVAIATLVKQPTLALPFAFLSHFVLDLIPHWDPFGGMLQERKFTGIKGKLLLFVLIDFFVALDLGLFFVWRALPDVVLATVIFFAAALANLHDALIAPLVFFGRKWGWLLAYNRFHSRLQTKLSLPWGALIQVAVVAISLLLALR